MIVSLYFRKLKRQTIVTNVRVMKPIMLFPLSVLPIIGIVMLYTGHTKLIPPMSSKLFSFS